MLIFLSDTKVFLILLQQWEYMFLFSISIINRYSCRKLFTVYIRIPQFSYSGIGCIFLPTTTCLCFKLIETCQFQNE